MESVITEYAPILGSVLGGPVGGAVGSVVALLAKTFGLVDKDVTPDQLIKAISIDPEAGPKLKRFEVTHKVVLDQLVSENERTWLADVVNAKKREVQTIKTTGKREINTYILV